MKDHKRVLATALMAACLSLTGAAALADAVVRTTLVSGDPAAPDSTFVISVDLAENDTGKNPMFFTLNLEYDDRSIVASSISFAAGDLGPLMSGPQVGEGADAYRVVLSQGNIGNNSPNVRMMRVTMTTTAEPVYPYAIAMHAASSNSVQSTMFEPIPVTLDNTALARICPGSCPEPTPTPTPTPTATATATPTPTATPRPGTIHQAVAFSSANPDLDPGWRFSRAYPELQNFPGSNPDRLTSELGITERTIRVLALNTYGFLDNSASEHRYVPSTSDAVLFCMWSFSANRGDDLPLVRLRNVARGAGIGTATSFTESMLPDMVPKIYATALYVDPRMLEGENLGVESSLDVVAGFGRADSVGAEVRVHNFVSFTEFPVSQLGESQFVYAWSHATDGAAGATFGSLPAANGGVATEGFNTEGQGLGIRITGTPVLGPPTGPYTLGEFDPATGTWEHLRFGFGFWERKLTLSELTLEPGLHRVDFSIAATSATPPTSRLRIGVGYDFVTEMTIAPDARKPSFFPRPDGTAYTGFFVVPAGIPAAGPNIAFDVYRILSSETGDVLLKDLRITRHEMPTLNPE